MIPPLMLVEGAEHPVLPPGIHRCGVEELRARFIEPFPESRTRAEIFAGFVRLRNEAVGHGLQGVHWINGSFVEGKLDPADIDVVSACPFDRLAPRAAVGQAFVTRVLGGGERTKTHYSTHAFLLVEYPEGHRLREQFLADQLHWRTVWGTTRRGIPKGFLEIAFGTEAPA